MDLAGRGSIVSALETGLRLPNGETSFFRVRPEELDFEVDASPGEGPVENVKYLDIVSHADPAKVLESLRKARLLKKDGPSEGMPTIELRLLGITREGPVNTLTFEDTVQR